MRPCETWGPERWWHREGYQGRKCRRDVTIEFRGITGRILLAAYPRSNTLRNAPTRPPSCIDVAPLHFTFLVSGRPSLQPTPRLMDGFYGAYKQGQPAPDSHWVAKRQIISAARLPAYGFGKF